MSTFITDDSPDPLVIKAAVNGHADGIAIVLPEDYWDEEDVATIRDDQDWGEAHAVLFEDPARARDWAISLVASLDEYLVKTRAS